jgi:hypothetical protein
MKVYKLLIVVLFFTALCNEVSAQRTSTRKRTSREAKEEKKEASDFKEKLNYEIKVGNINLGTTTSLALKSNVGYKLHNRFSAGAGLRTQYFYLNFPAGVQDISAFNYGAFGYARAKITSSIYLQGEYSLQSFDVRVQNGSSGRRSVAAPLVGGGYMSGTGNWSYGFEALFNINSVAIDYNGPLEYWINFSYKF